MTAVYLRTLQPTLERASEPAPLDSSTDRQAATCTAAEQSEGVRRLLFDCLQALYGEKVRFDLKKTSDGKPYLVKTEGEGGYLPESGECAAPPQISLSHSGKIVVCALSDEPVGVDVQAIAPISDRVMMRFLGCTADFVHSADDAERTLLWTRYEACLKRYGSRSAMKTDAPNQRFDSYFGMDGYIVTVCHADGEKVDWQEEKINAHH